MFFILPAWGLSNAAATLVGQNLGAGQPDRAAQAVWRTGLYNMLFLGSLGVFFFVFAAPVVRLFVDDPAVVPIAALALRTFSLRQRRLRLRMVMLQAFNGAGDTCTPTIVNFFGFWVLELPLAWGLAVACTCAPRALSSLSSSPSAPLPRPASSLFRQGRWKQQKRI